MTAINRCLSIFVIHGFAGLAFCQTVNDSITKDLEELKVGQREILTLLRKLAADPLSQAPGRPLGVLNVSGLPARGADDAPLALVEVSDYLCPFCQRHFKTTAPQIDKAYIATGMIRYMFLELPNEKTHPMALTAAEAGRCAGAQGRFWDMHEKLFLAPTLSDYRELSRLAEDLGMDIAVFRTCLDSGHYTAEVRSRRSALVALGVTATPCFLIGARDRSNQILTVLRKSRVQYRSRRFKGLSMSC